MAVAPIITAITAQTLQGMILRFALSLAISYITQKLFGPDQPSGGGEQADPGVKQRVPTDPANKLPVIYGEDKIHGSIIFADISSDNQTMAFIIALCEGPIDSINTVHWDDYYLTLNGQGTVTNATHPDGSSDDWLNGNLRIVKYPHGGRCTEMESFSTKWASGASNRTMPDVAYAYCELKYDRENNVTGLTTKLGFEVKGKLIRTIANNNKFSGGFTPAKATLRSQLLYPDSFGETVKFSDFTGNQVGPWVRSYLGGFSYSFEDSHKLVRTNGTYTIVDLGPASDPNAPEDIDDYLTNGVTPTGQGSGAVIEFDFVDINEQHINNHGSSFPRHQLWQPVSYTDPTTGVVTPDDGRRLINGLNIKSWGNNYSGSTSDNDVGSEETRVWLLYNWTDIAGVNHQDMWGLTTFALTPTGGSYTNWTEGQYAERAFGILGQSALNGSHNFVDAAPITKWGGRRFRESEYTDYDGVTSTYTYNSHQQYYTAQVPASILSYGFGTYSNNPAECLADYLTNQVYGCGLSISDNDLDLETFYNHKQFCDALVTHNDPDGNSVTSKRYECNGHINTSDEKDLNISDIISNSQSVFSYTLGEFQMITDATGSNKGRFDEKNIYGDISVLNDGFNSNLNELTLKYKSKQDNYQDDQVFLDYTTKYFNEPVLSKDLNLKFINSNVQAQRLGAVFLNKTRSSKIISFKTDTTAFNLQVNDVITVEDTYYNFDEARQLFFNVTSHNQNNGNSASNAKAQYKLRDYTEQKDVLCFDGTPMVITMPYNVATNAQLKVFWHECIHGLFEDVSETLTSDEIRANNKLGEFISLVEDNPTFVGPNNNNQGGGFILHITPAGRYDNYGTYKQISLFTINHIANVTSVSTGTFSNGDTNGKEFKINSISETELKGGLQGYYITAQEYNTEDYTVATITARAQYPSINATKGYSSVDDATGLIINASYPNASIPNIELGFTIPNQANVENAEVYFSEGLTGTKYFTGAFQAPTGTYAPNTVQTYPIQNIPTTADLYLYVKLSNSFSRSDYSTPVNFGAWSPANASTNVGSGSVSQNSIQNNAVGQNQIQNNAVGSNQLAQVVDFTGKTVTLPADAVKAHTGIWDNTIKTADFTVTNQAYWLGYFIDTTSNTVTITLPASPDDGDIIKIIDVGANASTNNIIIDGNSKNIQGSSSNYNISTNRTGTEFIFLTGNGWILTNN